MKKIIPIAICILLAIAMVIGIILFSAANNEKDFLNKSLQTISKETAELKAERKSTELKSTADEIANIERELSEIKQKNEKGYSEIISIALEYINILYNYDGEFVEQKDSIINNLKPITEETFLKHQIEPLFLRSGGNMMDKANKHTQTDNFCTEDDTYVAVSEYEDGSDLYSVICALHYGDNILYRELSVVQMDDGKLKVNYDGPMTSSRTQLGGNG